MGTIKLVNTYHICSAIYYYKKTFLLEKRWLIWHLVRHRHCDFGILTSKAAMETNTATRTRRLTREQRLYSPNTISSHIWRDNIALILSGSMNGTKHKNYYGEIIICQIKSLIKKNIAKSFPSIMILGSITKTESS